jgi:hypothetical protein
MNTYNGKLVYCGVEYRLYRHWSDGGNISIYDNDKIVGEYIFVREGVLNLNFVSF